jgi:anti-sigma regulatory factor (Ser/Thr protein kinase)
MGSVFGVELTAHELSVRLDPIPRSISEARRFARDVLSLWGIDGNLADLVALLASELVTNALLHGAPPIDLDLAWRDPRVRVEVSDSAEQMPVMAEPPRPRGRGGFGLHLIERLSLAWGSDHRPTGGKVVWFELEPTDQPAARDMDAQA